jgi:hypothetical protein
MRVKITYDFTYVNHCNKKGFFVIYPLLMSNATKHDSTVENQPVKEKAQPKQKTEDWMR